MNEIQTILLSKWMGMPLILWVAVLVLITFVTFRVRNLRLKFKSRDRELTIETDNGTEQQGKARELKE